MPAIARKSETNNHVLVLANVMYWVCAGLFTPFLSALFTRKGLSALEIGIVLASMPFCCICIQPIWTSIADRYGCRKLMLVCLSIAAAVVTPMFMDADSFWTILCTAFCFSAFFQALLPLCDSLVVEASLRNGADFSRIRMGGTVGYAIVVSLFGYVFERRPDLQSLVVSFSLLTFALAAAGLPQSWHEKAVKVDNSMPAGISVSGLFDSRGVIAVLAFAFVTYVGLGFHGAFLGRLAVEMGEGQVLVGLLSAVSAASEIPVLFIARSLMRKYGVYRLLISSCFATAIRLLLVGTGIIPLMVVAQLFQGPGYMFAYYGAVTYISAHVLPGCEARGQSILVMVQAGLATIVANFLGGFVADSYGVSTAFIMTAAAVLIGLLIVYVSMREVIHADGIRIGR